MRNLEARVFDLLLVIVGSLLVVGSRVRGHLRAQVTRDVTVEVSSDDGVARRYALHAKTRTISMVPVTDQAPDGAVRFGTAREGLRAFVSTRTVKHIVRGMNYGDTRMEGNPALVLWFHGLTRTVLPIGSTRRPRRRDLPPIPVREPERTAPWSARITREPILDRLDPTWEAGWKARAKLLQLRATDGEQLPPG